MYVETLSVFMLLIVGFLCLTVSDEESGRRWVYTVGVLMSLGRKNGLM